MNRDIQITVSKVSAEYSGSHYKVDVDLDGVDVDQVIDQIGVVDILEQIDRDEIINFVRESLCCEVKE